MLRPLLLGLAAVLPALSAGAAPATPEEAARLTALFGRYISRPAPGEAPGIAVVPQGDGYVATVDVQQALRGLEAFGVTLDPATSVATLTPLPDGTWRVASADSPTYVFHLGPQTVALKAATDGFDGIYDPALRAFRRSHQEQTGADDARTRPEGAQRRHYDRVVLDTTGAPDGDGVDVRAHEAFEGLSGDAAFAAGPGDPGGDAGPPKAGVTLTYGAPTGGADVGLDRFRAGPALDLWSFLVAHPDRASLAAAQGELKALLRAGLPYVDALRDGVSLDAPSVTTPAGVVSARAVRFGLDASGLSGAGRAALSLSADGLAVPAGQLPPWSAGLVPTALDLHVAVDGFHAAEGAASLVEAADLGKDVVLTPEQREAARHAFWPGGTVTVAPSRITTGALDVRLQGQASLGARASGRITLTGTGLDAEIAALQARAGSDPGASGALGPLVLAKNLAKPGPDGALVWVVDFGEAGVTVNGAPLQ